MALLLGPVVWWGVGRKESGRVSLHEVEGESGTGAAGSVLSGGPGGWGRGMGGMLTASSCLFQSYSVFEIVRCCGPKKRSLGLEG